MKHLPPCLVVPTAFATGMINATEQQGDRPATPAMAATDAPSAQVFACYFQGTVRRETCQEIERRAREVIEQQFKSELTAKRLMFKLVNYELPENAHFLPDDKLPCPSLVRVRQAGEKDQQWRLPGRTWELVGDAVRFAVYVETESAGFFETAHIV